MKKKLSLLLMLLMVMTVTNVHAQRLMQTLGRGVVVAKNGANATITWRRLAQDPEQAKWNVYVNGTKINTNPVTNTNMQTAASKLPVGSKVTVTVVNGEKESDPSAPFTVKNFDYRNLFVSILFDKSPLRAADFNTSYVWPIDLDGDGEMDYVVNRKSNSNALDCYVEGYLSSGEFLWTVKLGPNELSCAGQDDMITVADMDCDGLGDVIIQSSDGTQFWNPEAGAFGLFVNGSASADTDGDGIIDYETQNTKNAPRYISVIDGMTGREKASVEQSYNSHYNRNNRAELMGDEYNKHVGHMGVFYFDGIHPAVVMEWHQRNADGSHHYYNGGWAYDFSSGKAGTFHELFNKPTGAPAFHQIRVGDVDGDGCDEMIVGGYTMDQTGSVLFNTGISHGDRFRTSDIDPERPGLETFAIQQYAPDMLGQILYDAADGTPIKKWYLPASGDVGRGECIDVDRTHLGWEMWSTMDGNVYDAQGNVIPNLQNQYPCEGIWWDDEPDREVVQSSDSHYNVFIQDFYKGREIEIAKGSDWRYVTVYAKRAAFWGDIIGDWREELILLHKENGVTVGFVGVTTDYPTNLNNIYCLQQDPHYRGDCSTKGYYQSPNPGFYLGFDMPRPQLPPVMVTDLVFSPSATSWTSGSFTNYERSATASYADGKSVLIDLYTQSEISVNEAVSPSVLYAMPVKGQRVTLKGAGQLTGEMDLWKSQQGCLAVNIPMNYSGKTYISEGVLEVNGTVSADVELRARGTLAGNAVVKGQLLLERALNYEGGRLMPGSATSPLGTITLEKGLTVNSRLFAEMDIHHADQTADLIKVTGDLELAKDASLVFTINLDTDKPSGSYKLMSYTGEFKGSVEQITARGLTGLSYSIVDKDNAIWLVFNEQREPNENVYWTGNAGSDWNYVDNNFSLNGNDTEFVAGDGVIIGDDVTTGNITIDELMPVSKVTFENNTKVITVSGNGGFSGNGSLVMNGNGRVVLNAVKSDYTGPTIINSGTVTVKELADGGICSSLGAASTNAENLQIGKATLIINNVNTATNRGVTLTDTATIQIASGIASLKGMVRGSNGVLRKTGGGQLNITYGGANSWKSTILQAGTLAMGTWNTTFGTATSPIHVTGNSTIVIFDNNSTSTVPSLRNNIEIDGGKILTVNGGKRCNLQGSLSGSGRMKVSFPYVRGDVSTNVSQFEGIIEVTSGQYRLVQGMDLSKGSLQLDAGVYAVSVKAGSGTETALTHKVGALTSSASDCTLATGTWNVGYLGTNNTYAGIINQDATLNKYGEGKLTLTGASTGRINVREGSVSLDNTTNTTTGVVTVYEGGKVCGAGKTASVTINEGGTLAAAKQPTLLGTLTIGTVLSVNAKGRIETKTRKAQSDHFRIDGRATLNNPCFVMQSLDGEWEPGTEYQVFTGSGIITLLGTPTFEPAVPKPGYVWDYSRLTSDGIIAVSEDPTGIGNVEGGISEGNESYYDLQGRKLPAARKGVNIIDGKKVVVK